MGEPQRQAGGCEEPPHCFQGLGFYLSYKLINKSAIVSWMLAGNETPGSETKGIITVQKAA